MGIICRNLWRTARRTVQQQTANKEKEKYKKTISNTFLIICTQLVDCHGVIPNYVGDPYLNTFNNSVLN